MSAQPWAITAGAVQALAAAIADELGELDADRVRAAVERAAARISAPANAARADRGVVRMATATQAAMRAELRRAEELHRERGEWDRVVELQLERIETADERIERAELLRELSDDLERELVDVDGALSARLSAFAEAAAAADLAPLLRLARVTGRWSDVDLEAIEAMIDDADVAGLSQVADGWEQVGRTDRAAGCLERVLARDPGDEDAHHALDRLYRADGRWPALAELLRRRAQLVRDRGRAEVLRELAAIHERELGDGNGALDAYRAADRLDPDRPEVLAALARLCVPCDLHEEALAALRRLARQLPEPGARADALLQAAEIAWRDLHDGDTAHALLTRARDAVPDRLAVITALATLHRERGELADAVEVLTRAADQPALVATRGRLLADAAALCTALGDRTAAIDLHRQVRADDPGDRHTARALVELLDDAEAPAEVVDLLAQLRHDDDDPVRVQGYLLRLGGVAAGLGRSDLARDALTRALERDPDHAGARRALIDVLLAQRDWATARRHLDQLLEAHEDALPREVCVELHHRAARCALALGDRLAAGTHAATALALDPEHRPTLRLRIELDDGDPQALVGDHLALAHTGVADDKASHFASIGDLYADQLGNPASAREMYREALAHRPGDRLLLTKSLGLVVGTGDAGYCMELLERLIDTERDAAVRARYRHVAAMILRDELARIPEAAAQLGQAIEDDATLFAASDDLEALLRAAAEPEPLSQFYYRRLEQLRQVEGRDGERLRLWDRLGELCVALGRLDDAVCAYEVGHSFAPDDLARAAHLADQYAAAGRRGEAIDQHQRILAADKRRAGSYHALAGLYQDEGQPQKARACDLALALLRGDDQGPSLATAYAIAAEPAPRALGADDWAALAGVDVDPSLSALFALAAPAFAAERTRRCPPLPATDPRRDALPRPVDAVLRHALAMLGVPRPPVYVDRDQAAACRLALYAGDGVLTPALILGQAALDDGVEERTLRFTLARRLSDLRADRIARLLCPRAADLARILELATTLGGDVANAQRHAARWLMTALHPLALDRLIELGRRVRARDLDPTAAARSWLEATERGADRIGLVIAGDLATCARALAHEPAAGSGRDDRIVELVWASVTEPMFAVRQRVAAWPAGSGLRDVRAPR